MHISEMDVLLATISNTNINYYPLKCILEQALNINPFSANPTKWSNTLKLFECV